MKTEELQGVRDAYDDHVQITGKAPGWWPAQSLQNGEQVLQLWGYALVLLPSGQWYISDTSG